MGQLLSKGISVSGILLTLFLMQYSYAAASTFIPTESFTESNYGYQFYGVHPTNSWLDTSECGDAMNSAFSDHGSHEIYYATSTSIEGPFTTFDSGTFANGSDLSYLRSIWCVNFPTNHAGEYLSRVSMTVSTMYGADHIIPDGTYVWAYTLSNSLSTLADSFFYQIFKVFGGVATPTSLAVTSDITTNTTWGGDGQVYVISGNVHVNSGVTLTLEPGAILKFDTATSSSLTIDGILNADGSNDEVTTVWNPVVFTSIQDDYVGNPPDTDGDGSSTPATSGDWSGITVNSGGTANLFGIILRYAGGSSGAGLYNDGGTINIASSSITSNGSYGIYNNSGTTTAVSTELAFQSYGLYINGGQASLTATSTIHDDSTYGVFNNTGLQVNATGNWWATSTGPSATYGSAVSGNVDTSGAIAAIHYTDTSCTPGGMSCASVINREILYSASTTYASELSSSISNWTGLGKITFISTSTGEKLDIQSIPADDVTWKGYWLPDELPGNTDGLKLNSYYLDGDSSAEVQNTITHELGHAQGLLHSYTGNVMFHNQSSQTSFGSQDLRDYYYLWQ